MDDSAKVGILREALKEALSVINDDTLIFAAEMCDTNDVDDAIARRSMAGGTLARNTKVMDHITEALETTQ